jgi:methionyl aminopeptidase
MSLIKTPEQIQKAREAGKILGEILGILYGMCRPGLDVWELETTFLSLCQKYKVIPACKDYTSGGFMPPFPTGLCISINNESVHCFPKKGEILKDGDLLTLDTVIEVNGMFSDSAFAKMIGTATSVNSKLVAAAKGGMEQAIEEIKPGVHIGLISHTMDTYVKSCGFNVLQDYAGHGIGTEMHEYPDIPCYGDPGEGPIIRPRMLLCIEALVCEGKPKVDNTSEWETKMHDGKKWLQFEHTVLVTDSGHETLTGFRV